MNITVCIRRLSNGDINPFDASAYEAALRLPGTEVTLLSMGPLPVKDFLEGLTRLGAARAILLSDPAFAGADTLATAYTLSRALQILAPDLIVCGRQAIDGDTGQVGPELAAMLGCPLVTQVMQLESTADGIHYQTRQGEVGVLTTPSLVTLERFCTLRLPRLRSKTKPVDIWGADRLPGDAGRYGLTGSPTRVVATFQNDRDRRKCTMITPEQMPELIQTVLRRPRNPIPKIVSEQKMDRVWIVGEAPREMAESISEDITVLPLSDAETITEQIREGNPSAVLWGSDPISKRIAPQVAAWLQTGLCADCTQLETDGSALYMYRPAFSGHIMAKIHCLTRPAMTTVRTADSIHTRMAIGIGYGARNCLEPITAMAARYNAELVCSRKAVDYDLMPYENQVGLTGKTVSPDLYVAMGISGAVHHVAGIRLSGVIIAVNSDPRAEIFTYADYGIVGTAEDCLTMML